MEIPDLFDTIRKSEEDKIKGICKAVDHANQHHTKWSDDAFAALLDYAYIHQGRSYLAEEIREWAMANREVADPPSKRAWGGIIVKASRLKIIIFVGYAKTVNPKAHRTPASLWRTGASMRRDDGI